jgi:predicted DsbA family dithiol-disulfide isomerase
VVQMSNLSSLTGELEQCRTVRQHLSSIEVYADVWCPFAHVGLRYVVERRYALGRGDVLLDIRAWPLELVNGAPLDPDVTASHVRELRSQVAPHLFGGFDPNHFPTTSLPALACVHAAYRQDPKTGEAVSLALRDALFEEGLDISRPEVLADLAQSFDVGPYGAADDEAVRRDWEDGIRRGVMGSPHFYCGDFDAFCPSLDISRGTGGTLTVKRDMAVLECFLANCFAR